MTLPLARGSSSPSMSERVGSSERVEWETDETRGDARVRHLALTSRATPTEGLGSLFVLPHRVWQSKSRIRIHDLESMQDRPLPSRMFERMVAMTFTQNFLGRFPHPRPGPPSRSGARVCTMLCGNPIGMATCVWRWTVVGNGRSDPLVSFFGWFVWITW